MHSPRIPKSSSTAVASATSTSVTAAGVSQPETAAGQHPEVPFVGRSTTVQTPESKQIPTDYSQQAGLRLLAEVSALQADPFDALATHQTVTFDNKDEDQQQPDDFSLPSDEPSQPVECRDTTTRTTNRIPNYEILPSISDHFRRSLSGTVPEVFLTALTGDPPLVSGASTTDQNHAPTDNWVILTGDKDKPFKCGYEGCDKHYTRKKSLKLHFLKHTGSPNRFRCYFGDCTGAIRYRDQQQLTRHINVYHTFEMPYSCEDCGLEFRRSDQLRIHRIKLHPIENEKKIPKRETAKKQSAPTAKWAILTGDKKWRFKCGYEGCDKHYPSQQALYAHFRRHLNDPRFRCYFGDCAGLIRYRDNQALTQHIRANHSFERHYQCEVCDKRFRHQIIWAAHRKNVHGIKNEQNPPNPKKK